MAQFSRATFFAIILSIWLPQLGVSAISTPTDLPLETRAILIQLISRNGGFVIEYNLRLDLIKINLIFVSFRVKLFFIN